MADYPLTPIKISTIDPSLPTGDEDASRIDDVLRQTRHIYNELLKKIMDDDGNLLAVPTLGSDTVNTANIVDGSVTDAKLKQTGGSEAVVTAAIRDGAVTTAKLGAEAVTDAKLASDVSSDANRAVGENHIKASAVTNTKIADAAVTTLKIKSHASDDAQRTIVTDHIKDSAITTAKIAASSVTAAKLKSALSNARMYWDTGSAVDLYEIESTSDVLPSIVGGKIKFGFAVGKGDTFKNSAMIVERGGASAMAGGTTAGTWHVRPNGAGAGATDFVELYDPSNMVSFVVDNDSGNKKRILLGEGTYYVEMSCAAYRAGSHFARIYNVTNASVLMETGPSVVGSGSDYTQDYTWGFGIITIGANGGNPSKLQIEHYATVTRANDGLGTPVTYSSAYPAANSTYMYLYIVKLA